MFKQGVSRVGLSIEMGTEAVPNDGQYHVLLDGRVVFNSSSKAKALREYLKRRDALIATTNHGAPVIDYEELLRRERALADAKSVRGTKPAKTKLRVPGRRGHR